MRCSIAKLSHCDSGHMLNMNCVYKTDLLTDCLYVEIEFAKQDLNASNTIASGGTLVTMD